MTGSKSKLLYQPLLQDDPRQGQPDIRLPNDELGWKPTVPLREGLRLTIGYFEKPQSLQSKAMLAPIRI
ncbi:hypothetical protein [Hyphomicrobium facile]|uniref:hypothetical protein n=1 Tax=Hyphomicrobium facile TaxID=51670 RepID=UPI000B86AA21|nr:hypothetical protein [Hyphomicrobium facile]